jgi:hypothetical protein
MLAGGQGVTKRCRLSLLTNSALVYESKCGGGEVGVAGSQPMNKGQMNLGDLPPYLTYAGREMVGGGGG